MEHRRQLSLTAGDLNSSFTSAAVTNDTQACTDGISDTVAGMRTSTDPFASNTESLATSGSGELERLRYQLSNVLGWAYWYSNDTNINFAHAGGKTNVQGAGSGRHVTAVGYHSWAGSARFPAIAGRYVHTTGLFWPAAHHFAISIDPAIDRDRAGVETFRFHAQALTLHHTAALRFMHSQAFAANWQYPHITAVQVTGPQRGPDGTIPGTADIADRLIFGHASTVMNLVGYGASHIALGSRGYIALGMHRLSEIGTPVANALYGATTVKAWVTFNGQTPDTPISDGFGVAGVTDQGPGQYTIRWLTNFSDSAYGISVIGAGVAFPAVESVATTHVTVRMWDSAGNPADPNYVSVWAIGRQ